MGSCAILSAVLSAFLLFCPSERMGPECSDGDAFNGYWWQGYWIEGIPDLETHFIRLPRAFSGKAVYYAPGVMEATADYNGLDLEGYLGGVALPSCAEMGHEVWLRQPGGDWEGPYLVVDCPRWGDQVPIILVLGAAVEVSFETRQAWGFEDTLEAVSVSLVPPEEPAPVVVLADWFEPRVRYAARGGLPSVLYRPPSDWRWGDEWHTFLSPSRSPSPQPSPYSGRWQRYCDMGTETSASRSLPDVCD